jgi:hypothetical protein
MGHDYILANSYPLIGGDSFTKELISHLLHGKIYNEA